MEKIIEELRAKGEGTIKWITNYVNDIYENDTKDTKNKEIASLLALPRKDPFNLLLEDASLGFIELDEEKGIPVINEDKLQRKAEEVFEEKIEILRKVILNNEMNFITLNKILQIFGYYSAIHGGIIKYIKKNSTVLYTAVGDNMAELKIDFEITKDNEPGEEDFYLKVTGIKRI